MCVGEVPFEPFFVVLEASKYRSVFSIRTTTQKGLLESSPASYLDEIGSRSGFDLLSDVVSHPEKTLFAMNPCHESPSVYLSSISRFGELHSAIVMAYASDTQCKLYYIRNIDSPAICLIKEVSPTTGSISYYTPADFKGSLVVCEHVQFMKNPCVGKPFEVWTSAFCANQVASLCCVAVNGHHSQVQYQWYAYAGETEILLDDEKFPLLYTTTAVFSSSYFHLDQSGHQMSLPFL